jgi:outer membrane protein assembly factor BamB
MTLFSLLPLLSLSFSVCFEVPFTVCGQVPCFLVPFNRLFSLSENGDLLWETSFDADLVVVNEHDSFAYVSSAPGSIHARLTAVNLTDGTAAWQFVDPEGSQCIAAPAVSAGSVVLGDSRSGSPGRLFQVRSSDGRLLATSPGVGDITGVMPSMGPLVFASSSLNVDQTGWKNSLHAWNVTSRAFAWTASLDAEFGFIKSGPALLAGGKGVVASTQSTVRAFHALTGEMMWESGQLPHSNFFVMSGPSVDLDTVFVSASVFVVAIDAGTGAGLWTRQLGHTPTQPGKDGNEVMGTPAVGQVNARHVVVAATRASEDRPSEVSMMLGMTGAVLWTTRLNTVRGGPAVSGGKVLILDSASNIVSVVALDLATGKVMWRQGTGFY